MMKDNKYLYEVMGLVGFAILYLQRVEAVISLCWFLYARRENEPDPVFVFDGDYDELRKRNSKKVLGRFLIDISNSGHFKAAFEKRFERFVNNRNRLIHKIFKERAYRNIHSRVVLLKLHRFVSDLIKEAMYFDTLFDAYLGVSFHLLAEQQGDDFIGRSLLDKIMKGKRESGDLHQLTLAMKRKV